jgi:hypothetical protein
MPVAFSVSEHKIELTHLKILSIKYFGAAISLVNLLAIFQSTLTLIAGQSGLPFPLQ